MNDPGLKTLTTTYFLIGENDSIFEALKSSNVISSLWLRQCGPYSVKAIPLDIPMTFEAWNIGRLAKMVSWVFKNSSVAWEDEITIVGIWPSRNDMMGVFLGIGYV